MSEGNQYLLGDVSRLTHLLHEDSVYAPALRVLIHDQVCEEARPYVHQILKGEVIYWDKPPLSRESWDIYAALTGFYSQALRLFGKDIGLDVWPGWMRSRWVASDWRPLPREFGWKIACRPVRGIAFDHLFPDVRDSLSYLSSWPHGWLSLDECREYAPPLHHILVELAGRLELDWPSDRLEARLRHPEQLTREERFELFNASSLPEDWAWQFQRGLVLLEAMNRAIGAERDLISVGY